MFSRRLWSLVKSELKIDVATFTLGAPEVDVKPEPGDSCFFNYNSLKNETIAPCDGFCALSNMNVYF